MLERVEKPLRIVCLVLGAMVLLQVARFAFQKNPLDELSIPELPTFSTNVVEQADATATNSVTVPAPEKKQTNAVAKEKETNGISPASVELKGTNAVADLSTGQTNAAIKTPGTDSNLTAQAASAGTDSNVVVKAASIGTNSIATNTVALNTNKPVTSPAMPPGGMSPGGRPPTAKKAGNLPPAIQARVEKITESELLAAVVRPAPMALFGIAGDSAFLRGPGGQTGVIKEGEEVGGIKLLKIGFNRVLVEQDGEKKELMVFSGFGGESLLPKENKDTPK
ncbi:MAG: hypothetical protein H0X66_19395 [Verrucomicrobia bacterium]|nr:hypothetical protein [Verrucomicrobiota bacterium]